ncbi:MAG: MurR/RpiR family transcriptional regulator [Solobacterium sp.]|nr:MurR/RpiR family transcriptional regulator [Solobacterium sp.]MBQ9824285.1 MurR/RpiR family transcriptional regulator [Solobacterium sp.]
MNALELMESKLSSFSKTDRTIYEMIKKFPSRWATQSITEISDGTKVTKPALTRFAKKLGFGGFAEFQYQLSQDLKDVENNKRNTSRADVYAKLLSQTEESADRNQLKKLAERMCQSRKVILAGSNLSRLPAEELLIALSLHDDIVSMMPPADITPYNYSEKDMVILYSAITGASHQEFLKAFRREGVTKPYLVLVTVNSKHPLRHNFDEVIVLPTLRLQDSSNIVLSDTFAFLMFNDLLTAELDS